MGETWERHGRDMGETWARHGRDMGETWARHGRDMGETWARHGRDMGETWARHGRDIGQTGDKHSWTTVQTKKKSFLADFLFLVERTRNWPVESKNAAESIFFTARRRTGVCKSDDSLSEGKNLAC